MCAGMQPQQRPVAATPAPMPLGAPLPTKQDFSRFQSDWHFRCVRTWSVVCICVCERIGGVGASKVGPRELYTLLPLLQLASTQAGAAAGNVLSFLAAKLPSMPMLWLILLNAADNRLGLGNVQSPEAAASASTLPDALGKPCSANVAL